ncbi:calcium/sodium antiporter [Agathobacter sp.]
MIFVAILMLAAGFFALVKGADVFVDGAAALAGRFGIPQLVIGLTIVAMGTSLPEAAVSITAGMKGNAGITVGNIVGSNILNILIILGVTALISNVAIQRSTFRYEIPYMLFITAVLLVMGATGNEITFVEGVILWVLFIVYLVYLYFLSKKGEQGEEQDQQIKQYKLWKCLVFIVLGGVLVVGGSNFVVNGATTIARACGMSERFIGLTIVAFGTSLPELVTSVSAARKGNAGIAIGNIVGSNIFNILFVIGTVALICPVPFENRFAIDTVVAIACGVLLWGGTIRHKELRKPCGIVMLAGYVMYFIYLAVV